jgi:hypothetical protein
MAAIDCPGIILPSDIPKLEPIEKEREQEPGVAKAICTWKQLIEFVKKVELWKPLHLVFL